MEKDFKSPVSTIPPRGQVLDLFAECGDGSGENARSDRAQKTRHVGTDTQNPAQVSLAIPMAALSPEFQEDFWSKVEKGPGCWEWRGWYGGKTYGRLRLPHSRAQFRAHRIAYAIAFEKDPGELFVCHKCDNPKCVRPDHLFLGTHQDNMDDMHAKGRHNPAPSAGSANGNASIGEGDVREIVGLILKGHSNKKIAESFAVGHALISRIRTGRSWRSVTEAMGYDPKPGDFESCRLPFQSTPWPE